MALTPRHSPGNGLGIRRVAGTGQGWSREVCSCPLPAAAAAAPRLGPDRIQARLLCSRQDRMRERGG